MLQNDGDLDEQEILDANKGEQIDENDSESDNRYSLC